jgi:hypothetical protein
VLIARLLFKSLLLSHFLISKSAIQQLYTLHVRTSLYDAFIRLDDALLCALKVFLGKVVLTTVLH